MSDAQNPPTEVQPGAVLAGRYRVENQIGAGGMGIVVAARHLQLGSRVAIKYLPSSALSDPDTLERFQREAWAAAQIKSPHVVRVSDVASLPSGAPFIVMEYLEGEDLAQVLARHEKWSIAEAVELVLQVCEAIAEAHAIGIVHRDLKPSNIFVTKNLEGHRVAKVLDFGISKLTRDEFALLGLTTTHTSLGSPSYMSPEQMHSSKEVDGRTDIWALGVILYELLAGRAPFTGTNLPELALQIATQSAPPLAAADVPAGLERIVQRCLEKDRLKRYPDVAALASALTEFAPLTASLHVARAERVLRDAGASLPSPSQTLIGVGESRARVSLREVKRADSPPPPPWGARAGGGALRHSESPDARGSDPRSHRAERPGGARTSDKVPRRPGDPDATRAARGSARPSARGSERPRSARTSDKVPKRRERGDPSGKVSTRVARGEGASAAAACASGPAEDLPARAHPRKLGRPVVLLTAAVAVAVLLLAALALTAFLGTGSENAVRPGAQLPRRVTTDEAVPVSPKVPENSGK